ncbi:alpha/beta fold hydrolase [uncultured Paraglaciecola sp.]|uniref:alpha/beta hydrolase n=1 Tax=uncultured Paraglaciecola sp. TaxID=1765024 RepID=UPI002616B01C|nr:alpha/beta fold hydrolase [uncultured Paraglaciecola sp.]
MHCFKIFIITLAVLAIFSTRAEESLPKNQNGQKLANFPSCTLENGATIKPCKIGYRTFGKLNENADNAVLIPTWFTGNSADHSYLAAKNIIDPNRYFVVIVDALGNGVSSSPSNSKTQADGDFPLFNIGDMVDSQYRLLTEVLGVKQLHAVVGLSMGGMQAFEWAVRYPDFMTNTVAVIGTPKLPSFDIALWETRNRLMELYRLCECEAALQAVVGVGMLGDMPGTLAANTQPKGIAPTMENRAKTYFESPRQSWDHQRQAQAMIKHNIARNLQNDMQQAAKAIKSKVLIIVGKDDRVVTPAPALAFAKMLKAQTLILDNGCGHGEPWCEADTFAKTVSEFLQE